MWCITLIWYHLRTNGTFIATLNVLSPLILRKRCVRATAIIGSWLLQKYSENTPKNFLPSSVDGRIRTINVINTLLTNPGKNVVWSWKTLLFKRKLRLLRLGYRAQCCVLSLVSAWQWNRKLFQIIFFRDYVLPNWPLCNRPTHLIPNDEINVIN